MLLNGLARTLTVLGSAFALVEAKGESTSVRCKYVTFEVDSTSENVVFSAELDPKNTTAASDFMNREAAGTITTIGTIQVSERFTIERYYCEPSKPSTKALQVLVHGITYNKTMWAGYGMREYDWQSYAASQGYPNLAINRLGHWCNPQYPNAL